jgi:hypothetical protein
MDRGRRVALGQLVRATALVIWCLLAAVAVAIDLLGRQRVGRLAPLSQALQALRAPAVGRACLVLAWMWLGWHVFSR